MKQVSIEMPLVSGCSAVECVYNRNSDCHARAITVGDGVHPGCDTYFNLPAPETFHTKAKHQIAGVGACKVSLCQHNTDYECHADVIAVGRTAEQANCLTFHAR
ncbi:DUF1540 domain-containing protein [Lacisediminimonas profundi]|uniref:DUF1540 domain-containing protein n=1 Tax=Lacisediminimonas profundi TaxID=2603856 RepID=UPI00124BB98C|nr:DUF1540 domain-containing protein [Lacisediminimonas profundi]